MFTTRFSKTHRGKLHWKLQLNIWERERERERERENVIIRYTLTVSHLAFCLSFSNFANSRRSWGKKGVSACPWISFCMAEGLNGKPCLFTSQNLINIETFKTIALQKFKPMTLTIGLFIIKSCSFQWCVLFFGVCKLRRSCHICGKGLQGWSPLKQSNCRNLTWIVANSFQIRSKAKPIPSIPPTTPKMIAKALASFGHTEVKKVGQVLQYWILLVNVILAAMKQLKQLHRKPRKKLWGFNWNRTHDFRDTSAMLYQLSYKASLEAGQVRVQFIPAIRREWGDAYKI